MATDGKNTFKVIVRGQTFTLSRSQIESEPNSLFAKSFLGDFQESQSRELRLDRHPVTFSLILDHLSGYRILPLGEAYATHHRMDGKQVLRYLEDDVDYYGLERLSFLLAEEREAMKAGKDQVESKMNLLETHDASAEYRALLASAKAHPDSIKLTVELVLDRIYESNSKSMVWSMASNYEDCYSHTDETLREVKTLLNLPVAVRNKRYMS